MSFSNINSSNSFNVSRFFSDAIDFSVVSDNEVIDFNYNTSTEQESSELDSNPLEKNIWEPEPNEVDTTPIDDLFFSDSNFTAITTPSVPKIKKGLSVNILQELAKHNGFVERKMISTSLSAKRQINKFITDKFIEKNEKNLIKITQLGLRYLKNKKPTLVFTILKTLVELESFADRQVISTDKHAYKAINTLLKKEYIEESSNQLRVTQAGRDYYNKMIKTFVPLYSRKPKRPFVEDLSVEEQPPKKKQKIDQKPRNETRALKAVVIEDPMVIDEQAVPFKIEDTIGHQSTRISGIYVLKGENSSLRESKPKLTPFAQEILIHLSQINKKTTLSQLRSKFANNWSFASETSILFLKGLGCIRRNDERIQITPKGFYILQQLSYEDHQ